MRVYWLEQALADLPADDDWLSAGESARLAALHVPKRLADWRLGRWTAKRTIATYLQTPSVGLQDIELRPAPSGAPEVFIHDRSAPLTISLTHSHGVAVCAIASALCHSDEGGSPRRNPLSTVCHSDEGSSPRRNPLLGCDLEFIEPRDPVFLADYFTAEEQALVASVAQPPPAVLTTLLWSAKESALKAKRNGLRMDTRDLTVLPELHSDEDWRALEVRCISGERFHGWWSHRGDFVLTLVAQPSASIPIAIEIAATEYSKLLV